MNFFFEVDSLHISLGEDAATLFSFLMESLIDINQQYLRQNPATSPLYRLGHRIKYVEDSISWKDIAAVVRTGRASCQDLAAWRIAELRQAGRDAKIHLVLYRSQDKDLFHAQVWINGTVEDPTKMLTS